METLTYIPPPRKNIVKEAFLQEVPRKGLLKHLISEDDLKDSSELFSAMNPETREEFKSDMLAFMNEEEKLIEEGKKGVFALYNKGKLYCIGADFDRLLNFFYRIAGYQTCYCDKVGGY